MALAERPWVATGREKVAAALAPAVAAGEVAKAAARAAGATGVATGWAAVAKDRVERETVAGWAEGGLEAVVSVEVAAATATAVAWAAEEAASDPAMAADSRAQAEALVARGASMAVAGWAAEEVVEVERGRPTARTVRRRLRMSRLAGRRCT